MGFSMGVRMEHVQKHHFAMELPMGVRKPMSQFAMGSPWVHAKTLPPTVPTNPTSSWDRQDLT
mgnify:CR=1 FL=1